MRDDAVQARGALGEPIRHDALLGFINRNYECDELGQWFFQNGPQRVYVELVYTPWVVRLAEDGDSGLLGLTDQAGQRFEPAAAYCDDEGGVLFADAAEPPRIAVLHDHDLDLFADHAELDADWQMGQMAQTGRFEWRADRMLALQAIRRAEVAGRFGFVASPAARADADATGAADASDTSGAAG
jgi:hypothetical protein